MVMVDNEVLSAVKVVGEAETVDTVAETAAGLTVTVGWLARSVKVPPEVILDFTVKVFVPVAVGAVAPEVPAPLPYFTVMILPLLKDVVVNVTVCPENERVRVAPPWLVVAVT